MMGAMSAGGGVVGAELVLIGCTFAVRGRSGEAVKESVDDICRSGNLLVEPILEATSAEVIFSCDVGAIFRSGLVFGLDSRPVKTFFNRPTGDGERL